MRNGAKKSSVRSAAHERYAKHPTTGATTAATRAVMSRPVNARRCWTASTSAGTASSNPIGRHPPASRPAKRRDPPPLLTQRQEHDGGQEHEGRFRVAHDENKGRRREIHEPDRAPSERVVVSLEPREAVQHEAEAERAEVGDEQQCEIRVDTGEPRDGAREERDQREEAQPLGRDRVVAAACDVGVPRRVPREQPLVDLRAGEGRSASSSTTSREMPSATTTNARDKTYGTITARIASRADGPAQSLRESRIACTRRQLPGGNCWSPGFSKKSSDGNTRPTRSRRPASAAEIASHAP